MVKASLLSHSRVNVREDFFTDTSNLTFCRVNESTCRFVLEVVFMVFECYKSLSFSDAFRAVRLVAMT